MSHISQERLSFSLQQLGKFADFQHRNFGDERAQYRRCGCSTLAPGPQNCTCLEGVALGQPFKIKGWLCGFELTILLIIYHFMLIQAHCENVPDSKDIK